MDKKRIHSMLETLTQWCEAELQKGKECVCTEEMGAAIDMVKDLAEAEKAVWEKCFYKEIVEGMKEEEELEKLLFLEGRAGYDRWRTSHGRFAPKGTGHETSMAMARGRAGFPWRMDSDMERARRDWDDEGFPADGSRAVPMHANWPAGRMGYTNPDDMRMRDHESKMARWRESRRHFTEAGTPEAKKQRDEDAMGYVCEAVDTMTDIFRESDPELQKKIKSDLVKLMREFGM